jgi:hypothetical protein
VGTPRAPCVPFPMLLAPAPEKRLAPGEAPHHPPPLKLQFGHWHLSLLDSSWRRLSSTVFFSLRVAGGRRPTRPSPAPPRWHLHCYTAVCNTQSHTHTQEQALLRTELVVLFQPLPYFVCVLPLFILTRLFTPIDRSRFVCDITPHTPHTYCAANLPLR